MNFFVIILYIAVIALILWLQIKLSKHENKYLGLIIPGIFFTLILLAYIGWIPFVLGYENVVFMQITGFILFNIPTILLLLIYKVVRSDENMRKSLDKSKFKDL